MSNDLMVVADGGGFNGWRLVPNPVQRCFQLVLSVGIKPDQWYQQRDGLQYPGRQPHTKLCGGIAMHGRIELTAKYGGKADEAV